MCSTFAVLCVLYKVAKYIPILNKFSIMDLFLAWVKLDLREQLHKYLKHTHTSAPSPLLDHVNCSKERLLQAAMNKVLISSFGNLPESSSAYLFGEWVKSFMISVFLYRRFLKNRSIPYYADFLSMQFSKLDRWCWMLKNSDFPH